MDKNKVVEFVKTHKKEIAIAAGLTAVGIAVAKNLIKVEDLPKPEASVGTIQELWKETQSNGETYNIAIVDNLTAADLGRLGEEMMKVKGINANTVASVIVGFKQK